MKAQRIGLFRSILIFILVLTLLRFAPVIMRLIQAAAIGIRGYWWAVLPVLVISVVTWKAIRRGSVAKKYEYQFESQHLRDVTGSAEDSSG